MLRKIRVDIWFAKHKFRRNLKHHILLERVGAMEIVPGLAIHKEILFTDEDAFLCFRLHTRLANSWTVTHIRSGRLLATGFPNSLKAGEFCRSVSTVDWTKERDKLDRPGIMWFKEVARQYGGDL